ncbi:MAG: glucose-6-phosphate isomerase [Candidatus Delongbacteria bacterium]
MKSLLGIDLSRMLAGNLGGGGGLAAAELDALAPQLEEIRTRLAAMVESETGTFANTFRRPEVAAAKALAARLAGSFDDFLLIGIGGSTWGTIAIQAALCHGFWNDRPELRGGRPRFHVLDNSDPDALREMLHVLAPGRTLVNIVSKSGTTAETAANFMAVADWLRKALGERWREHVVVTTDAGQGLLQRLAAREGLAVLDIPPKTGGRFSLLSNVGLFPAAVLGLDVDALLAGAEALTLDAARSPWQENRVLCASAAAWLWFQRLGSVHVLMPYSRRLRYVANWYVQLWGESLGKRSDRQGREVHSGSTPLGALGAADQHSLLQLFMEGPADKLLTFVRLEAFQGASPIPRIFEEDPEVAYLAGHDLSELINAEQESTAEALRAEGRGSRTLSLPTLDAYWLGQLFQFFMLETFVNGELLDINTFDQPGVEAGKILTYQRMGRPGFAPLERPLADRLDFPVRD